MGLWLSNQTSSVPRHAPQSVRLPAGGGDTAWRLRSSHAHLVITFRAQFGQSQAVALQELAHDTFHFVRPQARARTPVQARAESNQTVSLLAVFPALRAETLRVIHVRVREDFRQAVRDRRAYHREPASRDLVAAPLVGLRVVARVVAHDRVHALSLLQRPLKPLKSAQSLRVYVFGPV